MIRTKLLKSDEEHSRGIVADSSRWDRYLVPEPVIQYIDEQGLYSPANGTSEDIAPTPAPAPNHATVAVASAD
jgi:hypothetical protein